MNEMVPRQHERGVEKTDQQVRDAKIDHRADDPHGCKTQKAAAFAVVGEDCGHALPSSCSK
ncbi:MAG: hypothetical protein M5U05_12480 [Anaerolineales bacterium]|nr:hypothetical protein [Anaerolineales bacterium]